MIFLTKSRFIALYSVKQLFFQFVRMEADLFEKRIGYWNRNRLLLSYH